jgi:DNA/RNA endonuclease G (NUC1)
MPSFLPPTILRNRVFLAIFIVLVVSAIGLPLYFATRVQAVSSSVVISEFRTRGPLGGNDELIELYNLTNSAIDIGGWKINASNSSGTIGTRVTITAGTMIPAHGHFLAVNSTASTGYSGSVPGNQTFTTGVTDDGGIAILNASNVIIDQVGMSAGSAYKEGATPLAQLTTNVDRCHERKPGAASGSTQDTDVNSADFQLITPCAPQNLASPPTPNVVNSGTLQFSAATYSVNEDGGSATITVTRTGGSSGAVSVNYSTVAGGSSATAGDDYVATSSTVSFADGDTANKTFTVTVNDDTTFEGNETVNLALSSPTGGATLGSPSTAVLTIVENDAQPNQPISTTCPTPLTTSQGNATFVGVSANDPDGTVTSATITSAPVAGITLDGFTAAASSGGTATATLNVANTTAPGTYNVVIQYSNNDPSPQTATCTVVVTVNPPPTPAAVVISQVYGGGGNTGATLTNDYIELINHSGSPVNLSGWSVQAFVSTTNTWQVTPLTNFTLQPGQYYLVQESQGAGGTDPLPTPNAIGTIAVSSTQTKVALVNNTTTLSGVCPNPATAGIVDLVGYGSTTASPPIDCFEGSAPAPLLTNTTAAFRRSDGCFDTDDNARDFVSGSPNPRNSSSAANICTGLLGYGSANPRSVVVGASTTLTVHVAAAQDPTSTGISVTADLSSIGGSATQSFGGGPNTFTFNTTIPANNSTGLKSLPVTLNDLQGRVGTTSIDVKVLPLIPDHVTISQLYGGGGNGGATYNHDYVELYNPYSTTFDLTGWSIQYGAATGDTWQVQPLGGSIGPGEYYLIGLATNNNNIGAALPAANVNGDINMAAAAGKLALVNSFDSLVGPCPIEDPTLVDFLGYGTTANCAEGTRSGAPSATSAAFRKNNGSTDTDNNSADFIVGAPTPGRSPQAPIVEIGPAVFATDPRNGATSAPRDATIAISFTEPVTVDNGWYDITCPSGNHNSATVRSFFGGDTVTITPNVNFVAGEQCTVTIFKDAVHDIDTDDTGTNADTLPANKVFTFTVSTGTAPVYPPSVHTTMGNPSGATILDDNNYLMQKPEYTISYNRSRGTPNWVSWHLSDDWIGTLVRVDSFRADPAIPEDWYRVSGFDYVGSGFDRGHMTPNADRDKETSAPINQATFLMTNMVPQAPDNNQGPWANFEGYLRTLLPTYEVYIIAGVAGTGGTGSNGAASTIAGGNVTVPAQTWKVALVIPKAAGDDVARVACGSRTIAVIMPNIQGIRSNPWETYLKKVDEVETLTGYDFFSNLSPGIQSCVEGGTNGNGNHPGTESQSVSTAEETPLAITLVAESANANPLTYSIVSGPTHGQLTGSGANRTYTPDLNYFGPDNFTFKVNDGANDSNTSTVSITVTNVEDGPDAVDDSATVAEDSGANTISVRDNDVDVDNDTLTVSAVTQGAHGTVAITGGGTTVSYTPNANYFGNDSFTYTVDDGHGGTDTATVNVTVTNVQDAPDAIDDNATIAEDSGANTISVRDNDVDADNDTLAISAVTQGTHGSVTHNGTTVSYTPNANFFGNDSFTYTVDDGHGGTDTATVNVTVTNVQDAPDAVNDSTTIAEDSGANTISVRDNDVDVDNDTLTVSAITQGAHGAVAITGGGTTVSYTPNANYYGSDSFTYTVNDGNGGTDTATVNVTITNVNDAPVATGESYVTNSNTTLNVPAPGVLSNDTDIDSATLTAQLAVNGNVSHGSLTLNADGSFSYTPSPDFEGTDSFTYHANDGSANSNDVTVNITVHDTVPPVLTSSVATSLIGATNSNLVNVGLNASATDNSGDPVAIEVVVFGDEDDQTPTKANEVHSPDARDIGLLTLRLRGERVEANDGRVYLIVITATDSSGNVSRNYQTVVVPKSNKQANIDSVNAQAAAAVAYASSHAGSPPPGYFVIGDGPIIGPKQ